MEDVSFNTGYIPLTSLTDNYLNDNLVSELRQRKHRYIRQCYQEI